jgi:hypothetical protein
MIEATRGSLVGAAVAAAIVVGGVAAAIGHLVASSGRRPPPPLAFPRAFAIVNVAFGRAWVDVIRGRRIAAWSGLEWERPGGG